MKKRSTVFFLVVFISVQLPVAAQNEYYLLNHYTNENGLPSNGIRGIEYDSSTGFLWVGTESGLVRFDGLYFKSYIHSNDSLNIQRVVMLGRTDDKSGNIYLQDEKRSVFYINGARPKYALYSPLEQTSFLYYSYSNLRIAEIIADIKQRKIASVLPANTARVNGNAVFENNNTRENFLVLYNDSLYLSDAKKESPIFICTAKNKTNILKIDSSIYIRSIDDGFLKYNPVTRKMIAVPFAGFPKSKDAGKEEPTIYWNTGMKEPLYTLRRDLWKLVNGPGGGITSKIICKDCIPDDKNIDYIKLYDELHYIFIGSAINGLYVLKQNSFYHTGKAPLINESETIPQGAQAELYPGYILSKLGRAYTLQLKKMRDTSGIKSVETAYESSQGDLWYTRNASDSFVYQYKRINKTIVPWYVGKPHTYKVAFVETSGRLFAISGIGIYEVKQDAEQKLLQKMVISDKDSMDFFEAFSAIEWEPGKIGIAGYNLIVYDVGGNRLDTIPLPHIKNETVRSLWKYHDYIFIGTYGQGFFIYKKGVIKKMPVDKDGCLSYTHCFMDDGKGYCWMSTNNGLFKASLAALIHAFEHDDKEVYYHHLGKTDGIKNSEFNGGCQPCALMLSDSSLSFPGMNGFLKFHPESVFAQPPAGNIYIDEIMADSIFLTTGSDFLNHLPYSIKRINFKISVPSWSNPENLYLSYQLSPRINEWETIDIANSNIISFAALPPGDYTLKMRARSGYGHDEYNVSMIRFTILTPWYNSRTFYIFCLAALLVLTVLVIKWRTAELLRRKQELQVMVATQVREIQEQNNKLEGNNRINARLISIISHDMISPLKFMGYVAQNIKDEDSLHERKNPGADSIITVSRELESLSGKILDWIKFHHHSYEMKPEKFNLHELIEESIQIALAVAKDKKISFLNSVPADIEVFQYREAISEIVNNLAMNSVKNTEQGEINITYKKIDHVSLLTIRDTGKGMDENLVNKLNDQEQIVSGYATGDGKKYRFGHLIIKDLLQLINGTLKVESKLGEGSKVTIKFKDWEVLGNVK